MIDKRVSLVFVVAFLTVALSGRHIGSVAGLPEGWFGAGTHPQNYAMSVDTSVKHSGQASGHIEFTGQKAEGFGTLMQEFKADAYRGKRVRMSAWMKSKEADSAQLWMRVDAEKRCPAFDNMDNRPVTGTTDWRRYELVLDVPNDSIGIAFGAFVVGKGQAWLDDFRFETVGQDVASTSVAMPERMTQQLDMDEERNLPERPSNLDFEGGTQPERNVAAVNPKVFDAYAGRYQTKSGSVVTVDREGEKLFFRSLGGVKHELLPQSETEFFVRYAPVTIIFVRDKEGHVTHCIRRLQGRDTILKKIK